MCAAALPHLPATASAATASGYPSPAVVRAAAARIAVEASDDASPKSQSHSHSHGHGNDHGNAHSSGHDQSHVHSNGYGHGHAKHRSTPRYLAEVNSTTPVKRSHGVLRDERPPQPGSASTADGYQQIAPHTAPSAAAIELCQQIRWLREGSALVSTCDAVLGAKVDRIRQMQASREHRVGSAGWHHISTRLKHITMWLANESFLRKSLLLLACIVYAWAEDALRPRAVRHLFAESETQCFLLFFLHLWRRGIGQDRLELVAVKMQEGISAARLQAEVLITDLQGLFLKIQKNQTQHLTASFRRTLHLVFITRSHIFTIWSELTELSKANRHVKAKTSAQSKAFLGVFSTYLNSACFYEWVKILAFRKQVDHKAELMDQAISTLQKTHTRELARLAFKSWRGEARTEAVARLARLANKGRQLEKQKDERNQVQAIHRESAIKVKATARAIRARYDQQAFRIFRQMTNTGLKHSIFTTWKMEASNYKVEKRVRWLSSQFVEMQETYFVTEAHFKVSYEWLVTAYSDARLQLLFTAWCRVPYLEELGRLKGELCRKQQFCEDLEASKGASHRQQALAAASTVAHALEKKVRKVQHASLERMRFSVLLHAADDLRENAARQKSLVASESTSGAEMRVQALRRRKSAARASEVMLSRWSEDHYRAVLHLWASLASGLAHARQLDEKKRGLASWHRDYEAQWRAHRFQRARAFTEPVDKFGIALALVAVWRSWEQAVFASQAAAERQAEEQRIAEEDLQLSKDLLERKELVQAPLIHWVLQHLGLETGPAVAPSWMKAVLRAWHQAALLASRQARMANQKKAVHAVIYDLAKEVAARLDDTLLMRVLGVWWLLTCIVRNEGDKKEAMRARAVRAAVQAKLQRFIKASICYWERCEATDLLLNVFSEWRRYAGVSVVERTGKQVCAELDERTAAGRRVVIDEEDSVSFQFSASSRWTQGHLFVKEFIAALCFPAWRRAARAARLRRAALIGEEQALVELEGIQRRASARCRRWACWVGIGTVRAAFRENAMEVLCAWHLAASGARQLRRKAELDSTVLAVADKSIDQSRKMLWRAFAAWRQAERNEDMIRLEDHARELEDQLYRVAGPDGASLLLDDLSDSSSDDSSSRSSHGSAWSESGGFSSPTASRASPSSRRSSRASRRRSSTALGSTSTETSPVVGPTSLAGRGDTSTSEAKSWPWAGASEAEALALLSGLSSSSGGPSAEAPGSLTAEGLPTFTAQLGPDVQQVQEKRSGRRDGEPEESVGKLEKTNDSIEQAAMSTSDMGRLASSIMGSSRRAAADLIGLEAAAIDLDTSRRQSLQMPATLELNGEAAVLESEASQRRGSARSGFRSQRPTPELNNEASDPAFISANATESVPSLPLPAVPSVLPRVATASSAVSSSTAALSTGTGFQPAPPALPDRTPPPTAAYPQERGQTLRTSAVPSPSAPAPLPAGAASPPAAGMPDFAARLSQFTFGLNTGSSR